MNKRIITFMVVLTICLIIVDGLLLHNLKNEYKELCEESVNISNEIIIHDLNKSICEENVPIHVTSTQQKQEQPDYIIVKAKVTAYAPFDNKSGICNDGTASTTATGTTPRIGVAAVDPSKIPYGTQLYIPGYGNAIAEDTGGAMRDYEGVAIDVVMNSYEEAINWGVRYLEVKVEV
ncbi:3D domain-containing protein [Dehalobacter sp. 14DCB1]|uniref:3D domain-containing protein n=1 Tax=Dehalobacter sp. 14DCB1 TaxID=2070227 RepID=UPI001FA950C9|nr:3D domain-containing protein [Dehalobacter sp. 14DCB1]